MMKQGIVSLLLLVFMYLGVHAQNSHSLTGVVKDTDGEPVIGAAVAIKNTPTGCYTYEQGRYRLSVSSGEYVLVVSMMGYEPQERKVKVTSSLRIDFVLKEDAVTLESVHVYGKSKAQQLREGAYAVNAMNIKPLINTTQSLNAIVNKTTGVRVREEGGLGSDFDLSINGMSGNSIRYFLDGMPLDTKGTGVTLANLPTNIIDRIEIYKGVIPAYLGSDALGGAINIITNQQKRNFLDASYSIGSFHTHQGDLNAQYVEPKTGIIIKPVFSVNYSKNDYKMKNVQIRNAEGTEFITTDRRRFHDDYLSLFGQMEVGVTDRSWADAFFVSASLSKIDKELQTGSTQSWVYGMAERNTKSANVSARYNKSDFLLDDLNVSASFSHTWDHSETVDTTFGSIFGTGLTSMVIIVR